MGEKKRGEEMCINPDTFTEFQDSCRQQHKSLNEQIDNIEDMLKELLNHMKVSLVNGRTEVRPVNEVVAEMYYELKALKENSFNKKFHKALDAWVKVFAIVSSIVAIFLAVHK